VVVDLVEVGDGSDNVGADVALVVEGLETAPDADVRVELVALVGFLLLVGVYPLLDLDLAGAVVNFECDVCRLRVDAANLADKGDLGCGCAVNLEVGARVALFGLDDLLDGYRSERLVLVCLFP
jgi:hypothetical protein